MTIQLRVGGVYRNRKGEKVKVDDFDRHDAPFSYRDTNCQQYTENGRRYLNGEDYRDLGAEWDDKPTTGEHMKSRYETNDTPRTKLLHDITQEMLLSPNPVGPQPDPRVAALEAENTRLMERIREDGRINTNLSVYLAAANARIKELEALVPQPKVESVWWLMGRYRADLFKSLEEALGDYSCEGDILVRYDTITAPTGEVSYKCEVVT